jgi:hypothetical protein
LIFGVCPHLFLLSTYPGPSIRHDDRSQTGPFPSPNLE